MEFSRYAIYYTPPPGPLADFGAAWLGWDLAAARPSTHPDAGGLDVGDITAMPRRYGFHATIKPPFKLADGVRLDGLSAALARFCAVRTAVGIPVLGVTPLGRFLALTILGDSADVDALAADAVRDLDSFRAPLTEAELARRRAAGLSDAQERNLTRWGYPRVMDCFRFHMTLTGHLDASANAQALRYLTDRLPPAPCVIDALSLVGERPDGKFQLIARYPFATSAIPSEP